MNAASRRIATALVACAGWLFAAGGAHAATIQILNDDGGGEGFNDPTPVAAVTGNAGTTLGQQRLNAFSAAAAYWANRLASTVTIQVLANFDPLTCSPSSGVLGQAGTTEVFRSSSTLPLANTWYPIALANALRATDLDPDFPEIAATFNSAVDSPGCLGGAGWFYGIGVPTPVNRFSLYETVRHELGHGLGFATVANIGSGATLQGFDDVFMTFLEDHSTAKKWPQMTNGERATSAKDPGDLHWVGTNAVTSGAALGSGRHPGGHLQMYAPAALQLGSSVSHWDTALFPDEMMEPFATQSPNDVVTTAALRDLGWGLLAAGACVRDADTACLAASRFDVGVAYQSTSSGAAQVMGFNGQRAENDESAFFTFFSATNFEMGVKVLNACFLNGKYWVFISGLTNQGWVVTVRDSQTGAIKTYSNDVDHLSSTFADTSAFGCQ